MSEPRIAAIVCEGQTDIPIFREIIMELWPEIEEVRALQPELDATGRATRPGGWTHVKRWCEQHASTLEEILNPDLGDPIDLLLVAVDVDIAIAAGIADPPQTVGAYETHRLQTTIKSWLLTRGRTRIPSAIVLSTPVMAIETWIVAALFPQQHSPENIIDGAQFLVDKKKLRKSPNDGTPWKELHRYREFAPAVAKRLPRIRRLCAEVDRTCTVIERRRDTLAKR